MDADSVDWSTLPDVDAAIDELEDATPRAAAVLGGALLEVLIDRLLDKALADDNQAKLEPGEVDYFKKCHWAFRMRLISKFELRDLRILGRIRNYFAHSWSADLSFGSPKIGDWIRSLESPNHLVRPVVGTGQNLDLIGDVQGFVKETEKHRWLIALIQMMIRLLARINAAEKLISLPDHPDH